MGCIDEHIEQLKSTQPEQREKVIIYDLPSDHFDNRLLERYESDYHVFSGKMNATIQLAVKS